MSKKLSYEILEDISKNSEMTENNSAETKIAKDNLDVKVNGYSSHLNIYVPNQIKEQLKTISKEKKITISDLIRFAENSFFKKEICYKDNFDKLDSLDNLVKQKKYAIAFNCNISYYKNRANFRKFQALSKYFEEAIILFLKEYKTLSD